MVYIDDVAYIRMPCIPSEYALGEAIDVDEREAPAGSLVDLVYQNEAGRISRRRIEIVRWSHARNGFTYLRAYCFLREDERTFRKDRIIEWRVVERCDPVPPTPVVTFVPLEAPKPLLPPEWSVVTAAAAGPLRASPAPAAPRRKHRTRGMYLLGIAATILLTRRLWTRTEPPSPRTVPDPPPKPLVVPAPMPAPKPAPKPAPRLVPAPTPKAAPAQARVEPPIAATVRERQHAFRAVTGITSPRLEAIYRDADRNGDGALDWAELSAFQSWINRAFRYHENRLALRPDEFLEQGGGDCEDWALFCCGLLRYWGWDPYVGSFAGFDQAPGHAVCLVRVPERPARYRAWPVDADGYLGGQPAKRGWYVPVDYGLVGGLTNAVEDSWRLRVIWTPERIFGEEM